MAKDRLYVSPDYKTTIDGLKAAEVLDLKIADNKDVFLLCVALGLDSPKALKKRDGLSLYTALKVSDRAIIGSVLLGTAQSDDDVDDYANFDASTDLCEQCAESGYLELQKKYNDADCDEDMLERRMLKELENLYKKIVLDDL